MPGQLGTPLAGLPHLWQHQHEQVRHSTAWHWRTVFGEDAMRRKFRRVGRGGLSIRKGDSPRRGAGAGRSAWTMFLVGAVGVLLAVNAAGADAAPTANADRSVQSVSGTSALNGVACTSKSSCVAVGSVDGEGVVVPIDNGVPGTAEVLSDTDTLTSVTCTKPGTCIATGLAETQIPGGPNSTGGAVVKISDGQASLTDIFDGIGMLYTADTVYGPVGIACSDTAHCMAVGTSTFEAGFGDDILNGYSTPVQSISPVSMSGVECVRGDWCVADGQTQSPPEQRYPVGAAEFVQIGGAKGHISIGAIVGFAEKSDLYAGTCRNGSIEFCQMTGVVGDEGAVFSVVGESSGLRGRLQARAR